MTRCVVRDGALTARADALASTQESLNGSAPVGYGAIDVSSLLNLGGGFTHEISRWVVLQSFEDTYAPVQEKVKEKDGGCSFTWTGGLVAECFIRSLSTGSLRHLRRW